MPKGTKAIRLARRPGNSSDPFYYSPRGMDVARRAAVARAVAYMFLAYPLITENRQRLAVFSPSGSPCYASQLPTILHLVASQPVPQAELNSARMQMNVIGTCNPFSVSAAARECLSYLDHESGFAKLLRYRLLGIDHGSHAICSVLRYTTMAQQFIPN